MKVKAVLLDFDGVILDSWPIALKALRIFAQYLGYPLKALDEIKIRKNWGHPGKKLLEIIFPKKDENFRQEFYRKWLADEKNVFKENLPLPIIKGTIEVLEFLKSRGIISGLVTNRGAYLFLPINEREEILKNLDFVQTFGSTEVRLHQNHLVSDFPKPDPRAFDKPLAFLKERGISPKETIFLEDSLICIKTAKKRQIKFIGVCTGPIDTVEKWQKWGKLKPENVLNSIADLPEWLKNKDKNKKRIKQNVLFFD